MSTNHACTRLYPVLFNTILITALFTLPGPLKAQDIVHGATLPDLSGLAWIEGDVFLGIHDAKHSAEKIDWPRVSLIHLPKSEIEGITWQPLDLKFPGPEGRSSDMESACSIPDGQGFLFAESGQEGEGDRRIFHATYANGTMTIVSYAVWPVPIQNVEATEVCKVGDQLVFLYAERADGLPSTQLRWATISLNPLTFSDFSEITYKGVDPVGKGARPIVALEVDSDGIIYIVSAYDSGSDDGPYRSVVWQIGNVTAGKDGKPAVRLGKSKRLATLDGLKVECIAVREMGGKKEIFVGTDDEHFGGILRLLPEVE